MTDIYRIDGQKLMYHPEWTAPWKDGRNDWEKAKSIYPIYVEISPVGACNHRCLHCAVDYIGYKSVQLEGPLLRERLHEMGQLGIKSVMMAGEGEPLLHKETNANVEAAVASGLDVAFTTNGVLLDKLETLSQCTWVKVSVNAGTRETYAKVHRCKEKDWDTVWRNLREAAKRKGKCTLGVQMVVLPENEVEARTLAVMSRDAGVDYLVLKPYSQHKFSINRMNVYYDKAPLRLQDFSNCKGFRVIWRDEAAHTTEIPYNKCLATPFTWAYLMASGDLYSCSAYLLDDRFNLGNLKTHTFKQVWQGEKRRQNWELVRDKLDIHECRVNCRQNQVNLFLHELAGGPPHVNFI